MWFWIIMLRTLRALRMLRFCIALFHLACIILLALLIEVVFILICVLALLYCLVYFRWILLWRSLRSLWLSINEFRFSFCTLFVNGTWNLRLLGYIRWLSVSSCLIDWKIGRLLRLLGNLRRLFWSSMHCSITLLRLIDFFVLLLSWFRFWWGLRYLLFCFLLRNCTRSLFGKLSWLMSSWWLFHTSSKSIWSIIHLTWTPTSLSSYCWLFGIPSSSWRIACQVFSDILVFWFVLNK